MPVSLIDNQVVRGWCFPNTVQLQEPIWDLLVPGKRWHGFMWCEGSLAHSPLSLLLQALTIIEFYCLWHHKMPIFPTDGSNRCKTGKDSGYACPLLLYLPVSIRGTTVSRCSINTCEQIRRKIDSLIFVCGKERGSFSVHKSLSFPWQSLNGVQLEGDHC